MVEATGENSASLGCMAVSAQEAPQRGDRLQRVGGPAVPEAPVECCPDVVELVLHPIEPVRLLRAGQAPPRPFREPEKVLSVEPPALVQHPRRSEASDRILAHGFEHR